MLCDAIKNDRHLVADMVSSHNMTRHAPVHKCDSMFVWQAISSKGMPSCGILAVQQVCSKGRTFACLLLASRVQNGAGVGGASRILRAHARTCTQQLYVTRPIDALICKLCLLIWPGFTTLISSGFVPHFSFARCII